MKCPCPSPLVLEHRKNLIEQSNQTERIVHLIEGSAHFYKLATGTEIASPEIAEGGQVMFALHSCHQELTEMPTLQRLAGRTSPSPPSQHIV